MNYYEEVYKKRLNRFGDNLQSRVQGQRVSDFDHYKMRSTYRVEFYDGEEEIVGVLEPNKQDESETSQWLLVDLDKKYDNGTIFEIGDKVWMIMYLYETQSKGYNKYLVLKMTHFITWKNRAGETQESWAYFFGKMDRIIYDVIRSTARNPNYQDPNKETHLIMPKTLELKRQDYIEIDGAGYYVTGYDYNSTPGVEYFSLKESYLRTESEYNPEEDSSSNDSDAFWLTGGA